MIKKIKAAAARLKRKPIKIQGFVTVKPTEAPKVEVQVEVQSPLVGADRSGFYAVVRKELGKLSANQVEGFESLFFEWDQSKLTDKRWFAYMLATAWHETARTMQPISEYGKGRGRKYGVKDKVTGQVYYGRGYVQLTWKYNYERYGIADHPERALEAKFAAHIMIDGMTNGIFTGSALKDYFNDKKNDPVGARRIINGTDKAAQIAKYHVAFYKGLLQIVPPVIVVQAPA